MSSSVLAFQSIRTNELGAGVVVRWYSAEGRQYTVEWGTNLMDLAVFTNTVQSNVVASPPLNTVTDDTATAGSQHFYRIKLE